MPSLYVRNVKYQDHVSKVTQPYIQMNNVQRQVMCTNEHVIHEAKRQSTRVKEDEKG